MANTMFENMFFHHKTKVQYTVSYEVNMTALHYSLDSFITYSF